MSPEYVEFSENVRKYWACTGDGYLHAVTFVKSSKTHLRAHALTACGQAKSVWISDTRISRCPVCCENTSMPRGIGAPVLDDDAHVFV